MSNFVIYTEGETFYMNARGEIYRKGAYATSPSQQWTFRGLWRYKPFGKIEKVATFEQLEQFVRDNTLIADWIDKNGKPRYTIGDLWGCKITSICISRD